MKKAYYLAFLAVIVGSFFLISDALAQGKGYACIEHQLANFAGRSCPFDNAKLEPIEEWISTCPDFDNEKELSHPRKIGTDFCPVHNVLLEPAYLYYMCDTHPDQVAFVKNSKCPACGRQMRRHRVFVPYYCKKCKIWFSNADIHFKCPICGGDLVREGASVSPDELD